MQTVTGCGFSNYHAPLRTVMEMPVTASNIGFYRPPYVPNDVPVYRDLQMEFGEPEGGVYRIELPVTKYPDDMWTLVVVPERGQNYVLSASVLYDCQQVCNLVDVARQLFCLARAPDKTLRKNVALRERYAAYATTVRCTHVALEALKVQVESVCAVMGFPPQSIFVPGTYIPMCSIHLFDSVLYRTRLQARELSVRLVGEPEWENRYAPDDLPALLMCTPQPNAVATCGYGSRIVKRPCAWQGELLTFIEEDLEGCLHFTILSKELEATQALGSKSQFAHYLQLYMPQGFWLERAALPLCPARWLTLR